MHLHLKCVILTPSASALSEKNVYDDRGPVSDLSQRLTTLFSQVVVQLTAWNTSLLSLSLFAKGLTEATRWTTVVKKRGFLRRTPPGFKLLTHAFMWRKYSLQKSVVARGKNMHSKQMGLRRVSEMKGFPYRMRLPWEPEVDALTAADGAWVTASLQKMSHVALSHILTSAGRTDASNKLE